MGWVFHQRVRMAETIYLDYAATTPVDPAVVDVMLGYMGPGGVFANPASNTHLPGRAAAQAVEDAREQVAGLINANPDEIVWTSGATESINLAIKGTVAARRGVGRHVVTSRLEHSAVLDTCRYLAEEGCEITLLKPDSCGLVTPRTVRDSLRPDTALISLMQVNNETGTITDIAAIGEIAAERGIPFHVDAAQSVARLPVDVRAMNADFISLSGHKMYGPKGIGALYVRRRSAPELVPQIHGGHQEMGFRAGTLPTHQVVGMGKAAEVLKTCRTLDVEKARELEALLLGKLATIPCTRVNGGTPRVFGIANIRFACVDNESLALAVRDDIAISSGSACTSARVAPSHVLLGLGLSEDEANWSVRVSLGRFTSADEVERAACRIGDAVAELRALSDEWEGGGVAGREYASHGVGA